MVTQQKAQSANFGPNWPEVTGFGAGPNKQIFCIAAGQNTKNSRSWPRTHCLPFSGELQIVIKHGKFTVDKMRIGVYNIFIDY